MHLETYAEIWSNVYKKAYWHTVCDSWIGALHLNVSFQVISAISLPYVYTWRIEKVIVMKILNNGKNYKLFYGISTSWWSFMVSKTSEEEFMCIFLLL